MYQALPGSPEKIVRRIRRGERIPVREMPLEGALEGALRASFIDVVLFKGRAERRNGGRSLCGAVLPPLTSPTEKSVGLCLFLWTKLSERRVSQPRNPVVIMPSVKARWARK